MCKNSKIHEQIPQYIDVARLLATLYCVVILEKSSFHTACRSSTGILACGLTKHDGCLLWQPIHLLPTHDTMPDKILQAKNVLTSRDK
ncbi:MAG: hypothetical protein AAB110_05630 [Candidatus Desantisbacteria bacterium]